MNRAYTGGCACGAVRYSITAEPVFSNHCQCRDCQQASGAGHGSYMTFASRKDVTVSGQLVDWAVTADSGNVKTRSFCPICGSPVCLGFAAAPDLFTIHVASLDEPGRFAPQVVTYALRGLAWDFLDPALPKFDKMPPAQ